MSTAASNAFEVTYFTPSGRKKREIAYGQDADTLRKLYLARRVSGLLVKPYTGRSFNNARLKVPVADILANLDVIEVLLQTGVPLQLALRKLTEGLPDGKLRYIWVTVSSHIENNRGEFAPALRQFPRVFPEAVAGMIAAASTSGDVAAGVREARGYIDTMNDLKKTVQQAVIYPAIVFFFGIIVFLIMMVFTVPRFKQMVIDLGAGTGQNKLPIVTRAFFGMSDLIVENPWQVALGVVSIVVSMICVVKIQKLQRVWLLLWMRTPRVKEVMWNLALARFTLTFASSYGSLANAITALEAGSMVAGNAVIKAYVEDVITRVKNGNRLGEAMRNVGKFPVPLVVSVENGESKLAYVMKQMGLFYTKQANRAVSGALKLLEPVLIIVVVGFAALAMFSMFLPMIAIIRQLNKS